MKELALHILDIAENCITAGAARIVCRVAEDEKGMLELQIEDDGKGMSPGDLEKAADPFFTSRTTRRVGLGLPLLKQQAEACGGYFRVESEKGRGTIVEAAFHLDHPDRQPMGDLAGSWLLLVFANPGVEWVLECRRAGKVFSISSSEIRDVLGVDQIRGAELRSDLKRLIIDKLDEFEMSW